MFDDIPANLLAGIDRALALKEILSVHGKGLLGAEQRFDIPICEIGPYLALKLRAFGSRQAEKDAFDLLYSLMHYDQRTDAAVAGFAKEQRRENTAMPDAMRCLQNCFADENGPAPVRAAHFVFGPESTSEGMDLWTRRRQVRQDAVTLGATLLRAVR